MSWKATSSASVWSICVNTKSAVVSWQYAAKRQLLKVIVDEGASIGADEFDAPRASTHPMQNQADGVVEKLLILSVDMTDFENFAKISSVTIMLFLLHTDDCELLFLC